jgi:hypothetical protein
MSAYHRILVICGDRSRVPHVAQGADRGGWLFAAGRRAPSYSLKICLMRLASSTACSGLTWAGVRLNSFSAAWGIGENFSAYGGLRKFGRRSPDSMGQDNSMAEVSGAGRGHRRTPRIGISFGDGPARALQEAGHHRRLVAAALIVAVPFYWGRPVDATGYATAPVTRGDLEVIVTATGSVQPTNQVDVSTELSGIVRKRCSSTTTAWSRSARCSPNSTPTSSRRRSRAPAPRSSQNPGPAPATSNQDKSTERIDGIVAAIMAIGRALIAQEEPRPVYSMFFV